jgi:lysine decarboxylase
MAIKIDKEEQKKTPYLDAYRRYLKGKNVEFDVPGHHQGGIRTDFDKLFTHIVYKNDINCPRGMDNIMHPSGCIKEAQDLFAKACHATYAKFLLNGSTSGNLIMLMSALKAHDKVIMPRNVHKSAINGLILSGAIPIFLMPEIDKDTEIVNQISFAERKKAIDEHPDAKAVFVINPTYFGATCDLKNVVKYAHAKGMIVLVDEAHGSHFYFSNKTPTSAMDAGADMATLSIHKTGGSLTQSSLLLVNGDRVPRYDVIKSFNMITTTSPSSILMSSLDAARKYLVFKGSEAIYNAIKLARDTKARIDEIPGFKAHGKEHFLANGAYDYDETKLVLEVDKLSINGFEVYKILKDKYHVQVELAETYVLLCLFTIGSKKKDADKLVNALSKISAKYYDPSVTYPDHHYIKGFPTMAMRPRSAFHGPLKIVKLKKALNMVSKEMIMIYPPGIPLIIPGEVFTQDVIDELTYYKKIRANILSDREGSNEVSVVDTSKKSELEIEKEVE